ncbi:MAG: dihydroorotate dehydrogenase electron transfer subunit [Clostridiales bacterium]|nr:dihydroorotate dehydrogenase electron transfer subunit [Clostridiales bacterium]
MRNSKVTIQSNQRIAAGMYEMVLQIPKTAEDEATLQQVRAGQFINIRIEGLYLRRPISICDWDAEEGTITIVYQTVGRGTEIMSQMLRGEKLDILWPLGNGYDLTKGNPCGKETEVTPLLFGGGAGVPPMVGLCRRLMQIDTKPFVILGFRSAENVYYKDLFEEMGVRTIITTEDGSVGIKGFVTDAASALLSDADSMEYKWNIFACGPEPMLRAIDQTLPEDIPGQLSFEERMGCGFGACMGCSCETKYGSKRICKDGPVLERSEVIW